MDHILDGFKTDWRRARAALQAQLDRMAGDPTFPGTALTPDQRTSLSSELKLLVARYDSLLLKHH